MCKLHASHDLDAAGIAYIAGIPHISHITHAQTVAAKVIIPKPVGKNACLPMFCYGQIGMLLLFAKGEAQTLRGFWHLSFSVSFSASQAMLLFPAVIWCTVLCVAISPSDMPGFAGAKVWAPRVRRLPIVSKTICPAGQERCRRSWYRVLAARCARWSIRCKSRVTWYILVYCGRESWIATAKISTAEHVEHAFIHRACGWQCSDLNVRCNCQALPSFARLCQALPSFAAICSTDKLTTNEILTGLHAYELMGPSATAQSN